MKTICLWVLCALLCVGRASAVEPLHLRTFWPQGVGDPPYAGYPDLGGDSVVNAEDWCMPIGQLFERTLVAQAGTAPYVFTLGSDTGSAGVFAALPSWLGFDSATGVMQANAGIAQAPGVFSLRARVADSAGPSALHPSQGFPFQVRLWQLNTVAANFPSSVTANGLFTGSLRYASQQCATQQVVVWMTATATPSAAFGQDERPQFVSAANGGTFTASAIDVDGVTIPAHSVYWQRASVTTGSTFSLSTQWRAQPGTLNGSVLAFSTASRAVANGAAVTRVGAGQTVTVTATTSPRLSLLGGDGVFLQQGVDRVVPGANFTVTLGPVGGSNNGAPAASGIETLYQARAWLMLTDLCSQLALSSSDCAARVAAISVGGVVDAAFDPDGGGPIASGPAAHWDIGTLPPGAAFTRDLSFSMPAGAAYAGTAALVAGLDSARGTPASASLNLGIASFDAQASTAIGERIGTTSSITAASDDLPALTHVAGSIGALLPSIASSGLSTLGDTVMLVRIPNELQTIAASLPANANGRVFYATTTDPAFVSIATPPPIDLAASIGVRSLPVDLDAAGNSFWQALDLLPPADPDTITWLAFYVPEIASPSQPIAGVPNEVTAELLFRHPGLGCASTDLIVPARFRVLSASVDGGSEIALATVLDSSDSEPVKLAAGVGIADVSIAGPPSLPFGAASNADFTYTLGNPGAAVLTNVSVTLSWPAVATTSGTSFPALLSINAAGAPVIDSSDVDIGIVRLNYPTLAVGSALPIDLQLGYAACLSAPSHMVSAALQASDVCGAVTASQSSVTPIAAITGVALSAPAPRMVSFTSGDFIDQLYAFTLQNNGSGPLTGAQVVLETAPMSFNGVSRPPGILGVDAGVGAIIDLSSASSGIALVELPIIASNDQRSIDLGLRFDHGVRDNATHTTQARLNVNGCPTTVIANANSVLQSTASATVNTTAGQPSVLPGATLHFDLITQNAGPAVTDVGMAAMKIPAATVFTGAVLLAGIDALYCASPPLDASLDYTTLNVSTLASIVEPGILNGGVWDCPSGESTSWVFAVLDDMAALPPAWLVGPARTIEVRLRNDEVRDEPNGIQQDSVVGTVISADAAVLSMSLLPAVSAIATTTIGTQTPAQIGFASCRTSVDENIGAFVLPIQRTGNAAAMISYHFENGSALPGTDYTPLSDGTLNWTSVDLDPQTIGIPILDNAIINPATRSFLIRLVDPSGATIAPHSVIEVRILDDDDAVMHADGLEGNCPL